MVSKDLHISDQDLLMVLDGEHSALRLAQIRAHLASCWVCRTRCSEIEEAIQEFVAARHRHVDSAVPSADASRARLKVRLLELAAKPRTGGRSCFGPLTDRRVPNAFLVMVFAGMVLLTLQLRRAHMNSVPSSFGHAPRFIPDPRLTPGATLRVGLNEVCSGKTTDRDHFIPASLAKRVFQEYGVDNPQPYAYEVDYLITPELGGSDDIRNVWPEPYFGAEWNAHVKDALEEHLHQMVCDGKLDLTAAQQDISRDWVSAYKKYFHAEHPLREHLTYTKDRPWE